MKIQEIASVCHEANRELCNALRDPSQRPWMEAEEWQRASAIAGGEVLSGQSQGPGQCEP